MEIAAQVAFLVAVTGVSYAAGSRLDLFERFLAWSRVHERLQADETVVAMAGACMGMLVLMLRRWTGSVRQARDLEHTSSMLARARDGLHHVIAASPVVIFMLRGRDTHVGPVWFSDNLYTMFGYRPEEVVSRDWWLQRVHPDDRALALSASHRAGRGVSTRYEFRFAGASGEYRWVQGELRSAIGSDGVAEVVGSWTDITARKSVEEALRRSQQDYQGLFMHASDAILLLDPADETVVAANPRAAALYGIPLDRLVGTSLRTLSTDLQAGNDRLRRTLGGEQPYQFETVQTRADGSQVFLEVTAAVTEYGGRPVVLSINRDVTERKRAEQARAEIEDRYRMLADGTHDVVSLHDRAGRFLYVSPSMARATGFDPEALVGRSALTVVHPEDREAILHAGRRAAAEGSAQVEWRLAGPEGAPVRWFSSQVSMVPGPGGRVHRIVCSSRDVSERRKAEMAIRFQAGLLDVVGQAVIATDARGSVLFWNRFAEQLYGWKAEEALGRSPWSLAPSTASKSGNVHSWAVVMEGGSWAGEMEIRRRDGSVFPAMVTLTPLRDPSGAVMGAVSVSSDLSPQKRMEQQLRQAQKMEAVGRLAGGVAHDFNNMLTAIRGNAQLMMGDLPRGSALLADLEEIDRAAGRAADLTRQLLAFSRNQVLQPRRLDLNASVRGVAPMLRRIIGEDVVFTTVLDPALETVMADPAQVEQIILNLAVNARDAMPDGGEMRIETRNLLPGAAPPPGQVPGNATVMLVVSDTGCGMDADTMERIFEPFFTTKAAGIGTGLGLSTVYGIVTQSGGHVSVDSTPGRGTTFTIYLPRVEGEAEPWLDAEAEAAPGGSETVLVVEDEETVGAVVCKVLTRSGYRVLHAQRPSRALELFATLAEPVHLVITDVVMPEMSGPELAERLRAIRPEMPVLFTSGYTEFAGASAEVFSSGLDFLPKPFAPETLMRRVRQVLDGDTGPAARAA
jgi:PAS domain S-box-containing protein